MASPKRLANGLLYRLQTRGGALREDRSPLRRKRKGDRVSNTDPRVAGKTVEVFTRLTPILPVSSVRDELNFYQQLGFDQYIDPLETYSIEEFAAVTHGDGILFGLSSHADVSQVPPAGLEWQFETTDLESVSRAATKAGLEITLPIKVQPWGRKMLTVRSPNGYSVNFEQA